MKKDSLGDRMKGYENVNRMFLTRRTPTIIRLDGRAFHSFTKGFRKPFDPILVKTMQETAQYLCENIEGCKLAYTQSDEITLLLTDYDTLETMPWFNKNIQKMVSVSASLATLAFNKSFRRNIEEFVHDLNYSPFDKNYINQLHNYEMKIERATFDARVFNLPKEEVCNCFIWRQQDATRNAIQMVGQANFSHKQLQGKSCNQIQEMLFQEKDINFNELPTKYKRGTCVIKTYYFKDGIERNQWFIDKEIPIFTQDREYIEQLI